MNKPIFEYSDLELKSIGFDILHDIKRLEKNLDLIKMELERRQNSVRATMTEEQFHNSIVK